MRKRLLSGLLALVLALSPLGAMEAAAKTAYETEHMDRVETGTVVHVNPLFEGVISEEELYSDAEKQAVLSQAYSDAAEYSTVEEAADYFRERMKERQSVNSIVFLADSDDAQLINDIFYEAVKHTGNPLEGDYLSWQYQSWSCRYSVQKQGSQYRFNLEYTVIYNTTAEQEAEMTEAVNELLTELDLAEKSNLEKIRAIYDWICANVRYDFYGTDMIKFTGYGALVNKTAVCQGYSVLLYRLMLESGVDSRIIRGDASLNHSWNIVQLDDGYYYNVDATWDEGRTDYYNYLKTNEEFAQRHPRDPKYMTEEFLTKYPSASMPDVLTYAESEDSIIIIGCKKDAAGELVIPEGIRGKAVTEIYDDAFSGCENLAVIRLPKTITKIWDNAFYQCDSLTDVYYDGTEEMWNAITIESGNENLLSAAIHFADAERKNPFEDLNEETYYYDAALWAFENQITDGVDETHFAPEANATRGQVVTFLWRAAGCPQPTVSETDFEDVNSYAYYYDAVLWAVENGITGGIDEKHFAPEANATRGQVLTFLWRANGCPQAENAENIFEDVKSYAYYYDAVLWAVENGITGGIDESHFAPEDKITRGQFVTFLYRAD